MNSPLSDRDKSLLSSLANPSTDADSVLSQLPPDEVGPWLDRPEIQSAIAAAFELREIRLRFKLTTATDRAIDRMTAVFDANKDLADPVQRTETRQAAGAIFRLSSRLLGIAGAAPPSPPLGGSGNAVRGTALTRGAPFSRFFSTQPPTSQGLRNASATQQPGRAIQHSAPPETPPLDTSTPQAAINGVIAAFKQLPTDAPRAALKLVERAIADPINQQPVHKERFLTHLAASPALTARHRPITAGPLQVEGATATQVITYTLEDGTRTAALFRATRRDPKSYETFPAASWQIDCIHPIDTS